MTEKYSYDVHERCVEEMNSSKSNNFWVTFQDAEGKAKVRTWTHPSYGLCFFNGRSTRRGFPISRYSDIEGGHFATVTPITPKTALESYVGNLTKYKNAFAKRCHPHLWGNLQTGYAKFDISEFEKFCNASGEKFETSYDGYGLLGEYLKSTGMTGDNIVTENRYKTTTIKANAPRYGWKNRSHQTGDYTYCVENLQKYLDEKKDFHFSWRSNYDVTVEGKMGRDGIYRAWLSLEYYDCGNGHYYALINANSAVFFEKD